MTSTPWRSAIMTDSALRQCAATRRPRARATSMAASTSASVIGVCSDGQADGPDAIRRVCRLLAREGVDLLKLNLSGEQAAHAANSVGPVGHPGEGRRLV